jgi:hypothetical protein
MVGRENQQAGKAKNRKSKKQEKQENPFLSFAFPVLCFSYVLFFLFLAFPVFL